MSKQVNTSNPSAPPAVAVEVDTKETYEPTVVHAYVVPPTVNAQADPSNNVGICRRCGRQFIRPPGVDDAQASYYRCPECSQMRLLDIIAGSCVIC